MKIQKKLNGNCLKDTSSRVSRSPVRRRGLEFCLGQVINIFGGIPTFTSTL